MAALGSSRLIVRESSRLIFRESSLFIAGFDLMLVELLSVVEVVLFCAVLMLGVELDDEEPEAVETGEATVSSGC